MIQTEEDEFMEKLGIIVLSIFLFLIVGAIALIYFFVKIFP